MVLEALAGLLGGEQGQLESLKILVENGPNTFEERITALFNPNLITISKTANWTEQAKAEGDVPTVQFTHGQPATLVIDLLFDTYAEKKDVRTYTSEIFALATVQQHGELHRPPICQLAWGKFTLDDFQWVLENQTHRYTLFLADGTPVRATVQCTFKQWRSGEHEAKLLKKESADVAKRRTVRRGDTLSSIAGEEYKDPGLWRPIAEANRIDDPRNLQPGQVLAIPALRQRSAGRR